MQTVRKYNDLPSIFTQSWNAWVRSLNVHLLSNSLALEYFPYAIFIDIALFLYICPLRIFSLF